jgi:hypothetical protein
MLNVTCTSRNGRRLNISAPPMAGTRIPYASVIVPEDVSRISITSVALRYKSDSRGFETRLGNYILAVYLIITSAVGLGGLLSL